LAHFDHLVVGIRSLSEGVAEFERLTGVVPVIGGQHPGRGTENALVSLGPGAYLEIIAPQPGSALSAADETMRGVDHLRILTWAVAVSDVDASVTALRAAGFAALPPVSGSRLTPAGERLGWTVFRLNDKRIAHAPFFICWDETTRHPSETSPGGCTLEQLLIGEPAPDRLNAVLRALDVSGISVIAGDARIETQIGCAARRVVLSSGEVDTSGSRQ